jgi:hypothetical protein
MYKLINNFNDTQSIQRLSDNAFIPMNPDNTDFQAYLKWVAEGGVPTPAENT